MYIWNPSLAETMGIRSDLTSYLFACTYLRWLGAQKAKNLAKCYFVWFFPIIKPRCTLHLISVIRGSHKFMLAYFAIAWNLLLTTSDYLATIPYHAKARSYLWLLWLRMRKKSDVQGSSQFPLLRFERSHRLTFSPSTDWPCYVPGLAHSLSLNSAVQCCTTALN